VVKVRLDRLLVIRGIAASRERARSVVMGGCVRVDGERVYKPSAPVEEDAHVELVVENGGFVGRGGVKLDGALTSLGVDPAGARCLDIGSSTGGFTDCLLKRGALSVVAVDVGKNQLDFRLRRDPRVTVVEGFNARYIDRLPLEEAPGIVTMDVSFISVRLILGPLTSVVAPDTRIVVLVKPQFELKHPYRGFNGVVRGRDRHREILTDVAGDCAERGYRLVDACHSPLKGAKGNIEFFFLLEKEMKGNVSAGDSLVDRVVAAAHASTITSQGKEQ
jgi:23S rRNA (cytidine1920-2'-O)/16S rRNA (cytidine1409-2'-O)-methyltransferase